MNQQVKEIAMSSLIGAIYGLLTTIFITIARLFLASQGSLIPAWGDSMLTTLLPFTLLHGLLMGTLSALLSRAFEKRELTALGMLLSLALAATAVLLLGFNNQSMMPLALYALAALNGSLLLPFAASFTNHLRTFRELLS